jgi:choline dehydrogenase-like flavoprotein
MAELPRSAVHAVICIDGFHPSEQGGTVSVRPSGAPLLDYPIGPRVWEAIRFGLRTLARGDLAIGARRVRTGHDPAVVLEREADLGKLDAAPFGIMQPVIFSAHVMGGCKMGDDPKTSVVRSSDLRHHTLENLHVIDGSVFPTSLGVNPQLSIYGLAHLMATRLAQAWHG